MGEQRTWDRYKARIDAHGGSSRNSAYFRAVRNIGDKTRDNLSYVDVIVDGEKTTASIINTDNLNEKIFLSNPGDNIDAGSMVECFGNHWLVIEKDASNTVYTRAKMLQCNHLLKWVDTNGFIREQWCVIEDGTKYLTGEFEDRDFIVTRGDTRLGCWIAKNDYTSAMRRDTRFLIDDELSEQKIAYSLTKPMKVGRVYNDKGVFKFVLQEVASTEFDNHELGIADYYKYYPKVVSPDTNSSGKNDDVAPDNDRWF